MLAQKRLLLGLAALAAAGLAGCLNSTEPSSSRLVPVTESEIQAALSAGESGDSLAPVRPIVCDTLKARLALLDSTAPQLAGFSNAVACVCKVRPPKPPKPPRPDSLKPDSLRPDTSRPKPDTLRPHHPWPPRPDSVRQDSAHAHPKPPRPDTTRSIQ